MQIRNFELGLGKTFVIAELCSNIIKHIDNLEGIIEQVSKTGANAVKVQLYTAEHFPEAERASKKSTEFPRLLFPDFVELCHNRGLAAGASVFDDDAVDLVVNSGGDFLKLATREERNYRLLNKCLSTNLPIIASKNAFGDSVLTISSRILDMGCNPVYPSISDPIWKVMDNFGWSSHTPHDYDVVIAVSRGAQAIEKHIMFDKDDPEAGWSLYPDGFAAMVSRIRWTEKVR